MIGVGYLQSAKELYVAVEDLGEDEADRLLAADTGYQIAGMPLTTAVALVVAVLSAFIAYQQSPTDRGDRSSNAAAEPASDVTVDDASAVVWMNMQSDRG